MGELSGLCFLGQRHPLGYAKTVLLIGHHQTQLTEGYTVLQQCMGADDNLYLTGGQLFFYLSFCSSTERTA